MQRLGNVLADESLFLPTVNIALNFLRVAHGRIMISASRVALAISHHRSIQVGSESSMPDLPSSSHYILDNFKPSDRVAVLLRNRATEEVIQRIASVKDIAAHDFQQWLTDRNRAGFDIYIGMNTLKDGAYSRTKRDIHEIRHVYLDLDFRGSEALKTIQGSDEVPKPNFVLDTSPGKHQVIWKIEGATSQEAEDLQQRMAHEFGADMAATDASRVLRLPGFANRKYEAECLVRVTKHSDKTYSLRDFKLPAGPAKNERLPEQSPSRFGGPQETLTQSERDWAYAKRALARGDDPEEVIRRIADYRADEKHDPEYYARLTVNKAQAEVAAPSVPNPARPLTNRENDHEPSL